MTTKPTGARLGAVIGSGTEFFHPYDDPRDQPVDTNVPMIVDALARRGVQVLDRGITRDETPLQVARIEAAVSIGANLVALNAGTGSQADDTFWRAVSQVTGRRLVADPELRRLVIRQQRRLGGNQTTDGFRAAVDKLSAIPQGAVWLPPPGTAAPWFLFHEGVLFLSSPGPPVEARPSVMATLEHDQVRAWLAAAEPVRLITARFFGDAEVSLNEGLRQAETLGLTQGLPDANTCVSHGGAESVVKLEVPSGRETQAYALFSFLEERAGVRLFSKHGTLDELLGRALAGRITTVYGAGPPAPEVYLRLWGRTPVDARLFHSDARIARFAAGGSDGEQLAVRIAERGLADDQPDFAVAIVGTSPAWAAVAGSDGQRITAPLTCPLDRLDGVPADVLADARSDFFAHELMRLLYGAAQR